MSSCFGRFGGGSIQLEGRGPAFHQAIFEVIDRHKPEEHNTVEKTMRIVIQFDAYTFELEVNPSELIWDVAKRVDSAEGLRCPPTVLAQRHHAHCRPNA